MESWEEFLTEYLEVQEVDIANTTDAEYRKIMADAKAAYTRYRKFFGIKTYEVWESDDEGENWYWVATFSTRQEAQSYVRNIWYTQQADIETLGYYDNTMQKIVEA